MNDYKETKERMLRKINYLTDREVAVVLKVLSQYNHEIVVIREKSYVYKRLNQMYLDPSELLGLLNDVKAVLMPEESINWITKDLRASLWFGNYYKKNIRDIPFSSNSLSDYVDFLITGIDCSFMQLSHSFYPSNNEQIPLINHYNFNLENKLSIINNTKMLYQSIITERKYTDWIDINDQDQLYWAADYLKKAAMLLEVPLFLAQNNEDMLAQIYASLDSIDNYHPINSKYTISINKKHFISSMRKAWSQKKFRDKKDAETAQEYFLTRRHMNKLKKLANEYGLSSKEYLQQLIDEAYDGID